MGEVVFECIKIIEDVLADNCYLLGTYGGGGVTDVTLAYVIIKGYMKS